MSQITAVSQQGDLFPDLPVSGPTPGWVYACHLFQRSGPPMWKLGYTEASVLVRARQIACQPVAWLPGSLRDERWLHRIWKQDRVSPAAEFFWHGHGIDRHVLWMITQMPETLRDRQLDTFAEIMLRVSGESSGDAAA